MNEVKYFNETYNIFWEKTDKNMVIYSMLRVKITVPIYSIREIFDGECKVCPI